MLTNNPKLHMFDLRFAPNGAKGIKRNKNPLIANSETSQPYLTFPDFAPLPMPTLDISTDLGLLANRMFPDCYIRLFLSWIRTNG